MKFSCFDYPKIFVTHYAIAYDVGDPKRGVRLNSLLRQYCWQQQGSFFEAELTPSVFGRLCREIRDVVNPVEDNVIIYPLGKSNVLNKIVIGRLRWRIRHVI